MIKYNNNFMQTAFKVLEKYFSKEVLKCKEDDIILNLHHIETYLGLMAEFNVGYEDYDFNHDIDLIIETIERGKITAEAVHTLNSGHHHKLYRTNSQRHEKLREILDLEAYGVGSWKHLNAFAAVETMGISDECTDEILKNLGIASVKKKKYSFTAWNAIQNEVLAGVIAQLSLITEEYSTMKEKYGTDTAIEALYDADCSFKF